MGTHTVRTGERLAKLRELMKKKENDVNVYVVPSEDQRELCLDQSVEKRLWWLGIFNLVFLLRWKRIHRRMR